MSHPPIGIDLGTSTSIITAYVDGKPCPIPDPITKSPIVPSVVGVSDTGELLVGQMALDNAVGSVIREAKRGMGHDNTYPLGGRVYTAEEIAARVLSYLKTNAEGALGETITDVVISVPANYEDGRRRAVLRAAEMAGLKVTRLINEPTAAAMAYGISKLETDETILVYDFGGGTLDVTILEMIQGVLDVKTSHGVPELGGKDFDRRIMDFAHSEFMASNVAAIASTRSEGDLKKSAEAAKKALSAVQSAVISVPVYGTSGGETANLRVTITRQKLEELTRDLADQSLAAIDVAITKAGMSGADVDRVLLVGGTTWMPMVQKAVDDHLKKPRARGAGCDPDLAVSVGACISAATATGAIDPATSLVVQDVCTYGLGTLTLKEIGGRIELVYDQLIAPNTPIPFTVTRDQYSLNRIDQDCLDAEIVQDLDGHAELAEQTTPTGASGQIQGIPPSETGVPHSVTLHFTYDANHIAQLRAELPGLGKEVTIRANINDTGAGSLGGGGRIDTLWEQSPIAAEYKTWIERAEARLAQTPANAAELSAALIDLKAKVSMGDRPGAQAARSRVLECLTQA